MADQRKAIVLLSGGMDSCVCTAIAWDRHGERNLALLHAGYGQRTQKRERRAFEEIADLLRSERPSDGPTRATFEPSADRPSRIKGLPYPKMNWARRRAQPA